jgi:two-component system nitrate/nitrite sensor histidine kinase NarQ
VSDKQIKWLILIIPTLVIGLWEYVRHEFLLQFISMNVGNWLSPVLVFVVTMTLIVRLFRRYDQLHEQLKKERAEKAILQERERIARELHDGIAQTLFLNSVKLQQMKKQGHVNWDDLDESLQQIHGYVRESISNLKSTPKPLSTIAWQTQIEQLTTQFTHDTGIAMKLKLEFAEPELTLTEKTELLACIQEALSNIQKHAKATIVEFTLQVKTTGWMLTISDNGIGYTGDPLHQSQHFGLRIMQERVAELGGTLALSRHHGHTQLTIERGVPHDNAPSYLTL